MMAQASRAFISEAQRAGWTPTVKIDAVDIVAQLASGRSRRHLNHLFTWNHRWIALLSERNRRTAVDTYDFIDEHLHSAVFFLDQFEVLKSKASEIQYERGSILDLGVHTGGSTRALARIFPSSTIHGFDSFEGLPDDWSHMLKGGFGEVGGKLPSMPNNVVLYKGWFDDTLPVWRDRNSHQPIAVLRVDCDLYSSTRTAFDELKALIRPGTWIVFDELIGYREWRQHEYRAFQEFLAETGFTYTYVAYGLTYVIVKLGEPETPESTLLE